MSDTKVFVVTLKSHSDLKSFYDDMETPGGDLYIPDRCVEVANRRPISRSTHYHLTDSEAELLRNDSRVLAVELQSNYAGFVPRSTYVQSSQLWDKSYTTVTVDPVLGVSRNWGLLRIYNGQQTPNWGTGSGTPLAAGTITINQSGKNVDVVIVDGHFDPQLSELQRNSDGTGGSRVNRYNWFQPYGGTYNYDVGTTSDNNHGAHVAGIAAGNSQGWARNATIYNISPFSPQLTPETVFDYIREWHNTKPINPETQRRNPTIINNSWGLYTENFYYSDIVEVQYRSTKYYGPFTVNQLNAWGIFPDLNGQISVPVRVTNIDIAIEDCINDGIIVVGAAGNESSKIDVFGGEDYFNYVLTNLPDYSDPLPYNQGSDPVCSRLAIAVGAINTDVTEQKASYSNTGPRVNIYAPGSNITSCVNSSIVPGSAADPRGVGYLEKKSGSSMASPQVTGLLACLAEVYPTLTQQQAIDYIAKTSKTNQINNPSPEIPTNFESLQGGPNKYLAFTNEKNTRGNVYPQTSYWIRPQSGAVWPRTNYRKTL